MNILFKHSDQFNNKGSTILNLDLNTIVKEVRLRISRILDLPLNSFHLVTKKNTVNILMTDTWPLSFFIDEDHPKIKVKLLDLPIFTRKESFLNTSPGFFAHCPSRATYAIKPFDIAVTACKNKDLDTLRHIIEYDENQEDEVVHQSQDCLWGLLHYACLSGCTEIVSYLISKNVNCNKVTLDEWTPLQLSVFFQRRDCVVELLKHQNLQINKQTKFRGTALHIACQLNDIEMVKLLLEKFPVASIEDCHKKTPIELANHPEIFEIMAIYSGQCELRKYSDDDVQVPFCSEVAIINTFGLSDKVAFLYMDPDKGTICRYYSKEKFLDKEQPLFTLRLIDIQDIKFDAKRKNQAVVYIEANNSSFRFYTKHYTLSYEWVQRIKKATDYCMIHKQNNIMEEISAAITPTEEDSTNDSTNQMNSIDGENVDFSSFTIMDEIGNGSFGIVYKVQKINTGVYYAMKSLSKNVLQKQKQLKYAISECKIMKQLNHPFIVPLYYAFQTPKYLYLILELCPNGDLLGLLEKKVKIEEQIAKFYLAEIILALEYLHSSGIIYRDLKPANVLIDSDFHAKLADFGLAKEKVNQINPAMTMAGTPAYLPPEIVAKKGATTASDIYGLGPLFYELLTGRTPYYHDDIDMLFQNIKNSKLFIPDYVSEYARDFITQVMNKDPIKRPQISQIKRHQLFRKLNWEALLARKIRPPKIN